jgi:catechol 2,3-dioxygenase-like lactoylglutathione lyase family enzyme
VTGLGFGTSVVCSIGVADLGRSVDWYRDTLGFEPIYALPELGWAELRTHIPNVVVGLSQVEEVKLGGGATLTFGVHDLDSARARLERAGVAFDGDTLVIPDEVKLATFFDPDGNALMLFQGLAAAATKHEAWQAEQARAG